MNLLEPEDYSPPPVTPTPAPARETPAPRLPVPTPSPIGHRCFMPDGTRLVMTISRKVLLGQLFDEETRDEEGHLVDMKPWFYPRNWNEHLIVLWIASHAPADWMAPDTSGVPLYMRYVDFCTEVLTWADSSCLATMDDPAITALLMEFWQIQHAAKAEPVQDEKKTETPASQEPPPSTGPTRPSESSVEETPAG